MILLPVFIIVIYLVMKSKLSTSLSLKIIFSFFIFGALFNILGLEIVSEIFFQIFFVGIVALFIQQNW